MEEQEDSSTTTQLENNKSIFTQMKDEEILVCKGIIKEEPNLIDFSLANNDNIKHTSNYCASDMKTEALSIIPSSDKCLDREENKLEVLSLNLADPFKATTSSISPVVKTEQNKAIDIEPFLCEESDIKFSNDKSIFTQMKVEEIYVCEGIIKEEPNLIDDPLIDFSLANIDNIKHTSDYCASDMKTEALSTIPSSDKCLDREENKLEVLSLNLADPFKATTSFVSPVVKTDQNKAIDIKPFLCEESDNKFTNKHHLHHHIFNEHKGLKKFQCSECSYKCNNDYHLARHVNIRHKHLKPFQCVHCNYKCSTKSILTKHTNAIHEGIKPFKCNQCDYKCSYKTVLTNHITAMHDCIKPFECNQCERQFNRKDSLTRHVNTRHKILKLFQCNQCQCDFSTEDILNRHVATVHEIDKPFQCDKCSNKYSTKDNLDCHVNVMHKEMKLFECNQCKNMFRTNSKLGTHLKTLHKVEKPFQCNDCELKYSKNSHLVRHMRAVHQGLKPFQCN